MPLPEDDAPSIAASEGAKPKNRNALSARPFTVMLIALVVRALVLLVVIKWAGARAVERPFEHLQAAWIWIVALAQLLTYPSYVLAYRSVARFGGRARPEMWSVVRIVVAGFGPMAISGGFGADKDAFYALDADQTGAQVRVGAMAAMEWAVLAPTTFVVAIGLLVAGTNIAGSILWPWVIGLPIGVGCALWATTPGRAEKLSRPWGRRSDFVAHVLDAIDAVKIMARHPRRYAGGWSGTILYWTAEICALYAALRAAGLSLGLGRSVIAYATGYLASRRSLPLGGAGLTEALLVYSLYELHEPLGPAIAAVMIYRVFNFLAVLIPAMIAYRQVHAEGKPSGLRHG